MSFTTSLDAVLATATLTLRPAAIIFTRLHPIGHKYLHLIQGSAIVYALALTVQTFLSWFTKTSSKPPKSNHSTWNGGLIVLLGWVDKRRPRLSALTIVLNCLCIAAAWDFLHRGQTFHKAHDLVFSRIGYVDETSARIVVRTNMAEDGFVTMDIAPMTNLVSHQIPSSSRPMATSIPVFAKDDFVSTFIFDNLEPGMAYTYHTNASHSGTFKTLEKDPKKFSIVSTSCIKPFYPYHPMDHALRIKGLEHLSRHLTRDPVDMMLFLGDFIYIDLPVAHGWSRHHYTTAYRQVYASPSWTDSLRALPWVHVYDDHEIINDWSPAKDTDVKANGEKSQGQEAHQPLYAPAMAPFWSYQGRANPAPEFGSNKTHYTFRRGDVSFFVLDTRRYRSGSDVPDGPEKTMLGEEQRKHLETWLKKEKAWKVVVSSVPFTRNWRGPDSGDSWSGFLWERDLLLDQMKQTDGVIILSGDRHEHATTLFPAKEESQTPVIEFSTSPLNQFYEPFSRFHEEIEDTDISIFAHPYGNSKFGTASFDTSDSRTLLFTYKLVVDGDHIWSYNWTLNK